MESPLSLRAHPSAIWLRQELPVQRKRIFVLWFIGISDNSGGQAGFTA